jgi:sugar lactone lactonase YvrE
MYIHFAHYFLLLTIVNFHQSYLSYFSFIVAASLMFSTQNGPNGVTVAGGNGYGTRYNQLASPQGLCVDDDGTVIVADYLNNRIVEWKSGTTSGQVVAGGNDEGNGNNQLYYPTDVIVDKKGNNLIICDSGNTRIMRWPRRGSTSGETIISNLASCFGLAMDDQEYLYISSPTENVVRRWRIGESHGTVVAGGNGEGDRLDQFNWPTYIVVDRNHSVYVADNYNHRVMKWVEGAKEGIVVAGGSGKGNALTQLAFPRGVAVDQSETVYMVDYHNHRIMCWPKGATQGSIVAGGNGAGERANQIKFPMSLALDRQGKLYVTDNSNNRVQRFNIG